MRCSMIDPSQIAKFGAGSDACSTCLCPHRLSVEHEGIGLSFRFDAARLGDGMDGWFRCGV